MFIYFHCSIIYCIRKLKTMKMHNNLYRKISTVFKNIEKNQTEIYEKLGFCISAWKDYGFGFLQGHTLCTERMLRIDLKETSQPLVAFTLRKKSLLSEDNQRAGVALFLLSLSKGPVVNQPEVFVHYRTQPFDYEKSPEVGTFLHRLASFIFCLCAGVVLRVCLLFVDEQLSMCRMDCPWLAEAGYGAKSPKKS